MLIRRANGLGVGLLALIVLTAGFAGCTTQSHVGEDVKKLRPAIPPKPGDKPYQTAIRNYLVQHLVEPDVEDVKWYPAVEQRDGKGGVAINVKFVYREKLPGTNTKVERSHIFHYTSKGEVLDMGSTSKR